MEAKVETRIWVKDEETGGMQWHWWVNAGGDPYASVETACGLGGLTIEEDDTEDALNDNRFAVKCAKCKAAAEECGMRSDDPIREALVDAVMESDGGPSSEDERYDAENIADDIMRTHAWTRVVSLILHPPEYDEESGPTVQQVTDSRFLETERQGQYERGVRECRCGMEIDADAMAMLAHVNSDEHAQRLAEQGLERALHSEARPPAIEEHN